MEKLVGHLMVQELLIMVLLLMVLLLQLTAQQTSMLTSSERTLVTLLFPMLDGEIRVIIHRK